MSLPEGAKKQVKLLQAYKDVFDTPSGKVVLLDLVKKYVMADPIVVGDSNATHVNLGMQRLTQTILRKSMSDVGAYLRLIEESYKQNENHERS